MPRKPILRDKFSKALLKEQSDHANTQTELATLKSAFESMNIQRDEAWEELYNLKALVREMGDVLRKVPHFLDDDYEELDKEIDNILNRPEVKGIMEGKDE